ncbi:rubredoxin domain-containing protein [Aureibaculum luteum]|uniref:rubredoxin domain-containing protein n=1 Tax=Aureibaculum luteum TaxID=1548456 RepID=UPI000E4FD059|nr:rubredoxin domain-containing protein [Aureibaculum luteum]
MKDLKGVSIKGGIISPSELKQIINYAESLGLDTLHLGSRQDIIFPEYVSDANFEDDALALNSTIVSDSNYQNIVCSYVSSDIFPSTRWLSGVTYLYILEAFKYKPSLKINITDPKQQLVPLFSGQLNFIASEHEDYWYLNLRLPNWTESVYYKVLINSWDIPSISETIEALYLKTKNVDELFELVNDSIETNSRTIDSKLELEFHPFPYYEGMNKIGTSHYWLGLYWRNNKYYLDFLREFCDFCLDNKVGKLCITPWKSIIVKGIPKASKLMLEKLLGKSGINVRHSLLELNWHIPVNDEEALSLKKFIVMDFDQNDISTYGLTFSIANRGAGNIYFTSIVIEKNIVPSIVKDFDIRPTYNVLYCDKFDPNTQKYNVYAQDVDKIELSGLLMELSKKYFEGFGNEIVSDDKEKIDVKEKEAVYQCVDCLSVYSAVCGDKKANVDPGTAFEDLNSSYSCSVCDSPKTTFKLIEI